MSMNLRSAALRLSVLGALAVSSVALAANTDTVALSGSVGTAASVTAVDTTEAAALNLGGMGTAIGEQIVKVADVALSTNNTTGLTLTITWGSLTNGTVSIPFTATTVADAAAAPTASTGFGTTGMTYSNAALTDARDLYIAYTPGANQDPGTYTATMTLTVADNA